MSGLSRRGVLLGSVVVGLPLLAGCGGKKVPGGGAGAEASEGAATPSATGSGGAAPSASGAASPGAGAPRLESANREVVTSVLVGPAVRVEGHTLVRLRFESEGINYPYLGMNDLADVCLLSLEQGKVWRNQDEGGWQTGVSYSKVGEAVDLFAVFGALDAQVGSVQVLVPNYGVALGVAVVEAAQAGYDAMEGLRKAKINASSGQGLPIEFFSGAADGSLDTQRDSGQVTVSLASDVTFAVDSADLSAQADGVLAGAVAELGLYPSGGSLSIVGHTDDVADDAYNQALSEKRAASVRKRLGELMDLSKWQVTEAGKGESEPRETGTTEQARAANRRVEVAAKPADPQEAEERRRAVLAQGSEPAPEGPVGKGPEGVVAPVVGGRSGESWKLSLDKVTRIGSFLVGNLHAQPQQEGPQTLHTKLNLPRPFFYRWKLLNARPGSSESLTLLKGGVRYLAADYKGEKGFTPLTTLNLASVKKTVSLTMPVVWPDPGGETVTVDLPGADKGNSLRGLICRLTDVPVVQG